LIAQESSNIHALVADGLFSSDGKFFVMPDLDLTWLRELFRANVLRMLVEEGVIEETFARRVARWDHVSGFHVHNRVSCHAPSAHPEG